MHLQRPCSPGRRFRRVRCQAPRRKRHEARTARREPISPGGRIAPVNGRCAAAPRPPSERENRCTSSKLPGDGRAGVARRDRSGRPRSGAGGRRRVEPPGGRPEPGFVPVRRRPDVGLRQRQGPADAVALSQGSEGVVAMNTLVIRWGALAALLAAALVVVGVASAASHREAPLISLDAEADITDFYAFRSYEPGQADKVDLIMDVIPGEEPSSGPNYWNFDPNVDYVINVDNDRNGKANDVAFRFRFQNEFRGTAQAAGLFLPYVGATGSPLPAITSLDSPGLGFRQTYSVEMIQGGGVKSQTIADGLVAVPSNAGPRTMPDYDALAAQGVYTLPGVSASSRASVTTRSRSSCRRRC